MRSALLIAAVAAVLSVSAGHCQAQGWGGFGTPYVYGAGYGLYVYERLPQYSLFPPVYYKHPTPRSYGFSPYAYPPGFTTPDVSSASSRRTVIVNDYVPQSSSAKEPAKRQPEPLVLNNPYVKSGSYAKNPPQPDTPPPAPAERVVSGG